MKNEMKEYMIEYTLSNGDWICSRFRGTDKKAVTKSFINWTCLPKSRIISIELI